MAQYAVKMVKDNHESSATATKLGGPKQLIMTRYKINKEQKWQS